MRLRVCPSPAVVPRPFVRLQGKRASDLDPFKGQVRRRGERDDDRVSRLHKAPLTDNRHDAGLADERPVRPPAKHRSEKPALKGLYLGARVSKARHFENRLLANPQEAASGQGE